jgi:hypothetical protein
LIAKREARLIPIPPGGSLADYVPKREIVIKVGFVFSDRHAYLQTAEFSSSMADLPAFVLVSRPAWFF